MPEKLSPSKLNRLDSGQLTVVVSEGCELPSELQSTAPRKVPVEFSRTKQIRRPFLLSWMLVGIFFVAVVAGARPVGAPWTRIAFGAALIAGIFGGVGLLTSRRDLRYVRNGLVGAGYIHEIVLEPAFEYNGQVMSLKHVVTLALELSDGTCGLHEFEGLHVEANRGARSTLKVGDLIPIVWLPNRFRKTVVPYAFLRFNHDRVLKKTPPRTNHVWKKIGTIVAVIAIFAVLVTNLLSLMWCVPVSMHVPAVATIGILGAFALGGLMFGYILWELRREDRRAAERNQQAIVDGTAIQLGASHVMLTNSPKGWTYWLVIGAGSLLLGGSTAVMWAFGANQLLDRALPTERVVEITDVKRVEGGKRTKLIFRRIDQPQSEYSKEYVPRDLPDLGLFVGQRAVVDWHPGAFGWPWIGELRRAKQP